MGLEESRARDQMIYEIFDASEKLGYHRLSDISDDKMLVMPQSKCNTIYNKTRFAPPFSGVWSVHKTHGKHPKERMNHITVTSFETQTAFIGLGIDKNGKLRNDFWKFNMKDYSWEKFKTKGEVITKRRGSSATLFLHYVVLFGGFNGKDFLNDIHTIDTQTGEVALFETKGDTPSPRSDAFIAINPDSNKLYVWGGTCGQHKSLNTLSVLDLNTRVWKTKEVDISGRKMIPFVQVGKFVFSYGGSHLEQMIRINIESEKAELLPARGSPPLSDVIGASMVKADDYLFYFGGQNKIQWTLMYAYSIQMNWWFVFFITPDGKTVTYKDGKFNKLNLFLIPRLHSFSMTYSPEKKEIIGFLGYPFHSSSTLFKVDISEALSFMHLRDDMIRMCSM